MSDPTIHLVNNLIDNNYELLGATVNLHLLLEQTHEFTNLSSEQIDDFKQSSKFLKLLN